MVEQTIKKITKKLELFASNNIPLTRALDIIEATTGKLEELIAINTMRESLSELKSVKRVVSTFQPAFSMNSGFAASNMATLHH